LSIRDFIKLAIGTAKKTPHIPKIAPKRNTESKTTTAGNFTTPDIKKGRKMLPSIFCKSA
jgi:hypothetical protein